jgi:hypothetical protein
MTAPVTTGQIYWGAVPFVCIQVLMIGITIAFPGMVMRYQDAGHEAPPAATDTQQPGGPDFNTGTPNFGAAPAPAPASSAPESGGTAAPNFGTAPAPSGTEAPADGPNFGTEPAPPAGSDQPAAPNFGTPSG